MTPPVGVRFRCDRVICGFEKLQNINKKEDYKLEFIVSADDHPDYKVSKGVSLHISKQPAGLFNEVDLNDEERWKEAMWLFGELKNRLDPLIKSIS